MRLNPVGTGACLAAAGIALGAFGAHGLRGTLGAAELATFETGVRYQMYAGLALLALGAGRQQSGRATWLLLAGALIFSGSLYLLVLTGPRWLGAVTPLGGVLMIAGLLVAAWEARRG